MAGHLHDGFRRLELLNRIGLSVLQQSGIEIVLDEAALGACRLLNLPRCTIRLLGNPGNVVEHCEPGLPSTRSIFTLSPLLPRCMSICESGRSVVVDDVRRCSCYPARGGDMDRARLGAYLGVPLLVQEELTGIIFLDDVAPHGWTEEEIASAEAVARQVAIAIRHLQVFRERRETADRLLSLMNNVPGIVYRGHRDWSLSFIGAEVERLTGHTAGEFLSGAARWRDLIHPEDFEFVRNTFREAVRAQEKVLRLEYRTIHREGTVRWVADRRQLIYDATGAFVCVDGLLLDVTDRKMAEEDLRLAREVTLAMSEAKTRFMETGSINAMADVVLEACVRLTGASLALCIEHTEADGPRILAASGKAWETPQGRALYEDVKRRIAEQGACPLRRTDGLLFAPLDAGTVLVNDAGCHPRGSGKLPPGHPPIASFLGVPLRTGEETVGLIALGNRPGGFTGRERTILEELSFTAALAIHSNRRERERRSAEEKVRVMQRVEAVGRLSGGMAHDLNNLLTIIEGYGSLLLAALGENDVKRESVEQIRRAGDRASMLTRQLLAFSRRQILDSRVTDLNGLVAETARMLDRVLGEDVVLEFLPWEDLWRIKADAGQLEQVVVNLALNARDAMPSGGRLKIETRNVVLDDKYCARHFPCAPGDYVLLEVADTGIGMAPGVLERIFEPFFTTKEKGKGTGLGLSMVYGIVKQSGGFIWAYSEPGKGSVFRIYLPRVEGEIVAAPRTAPAAELPRGTETILVVDDDDAIRSLARTALERQGYAVLEASDPDEALSRARAHDGPIHLLCSDVVMPGRSGPVLAEALKKDRPGIRVLFASGYADADVIDGGVPNDRPNFLPKPFSLAQLAVKVREILDDERPSRGR